MHARIDIEILTFEISEILLQTGDIALVIHSDIERASNRRIQKSAYPLENIIRLQGQIRLHIIIRGIDH